MFKTSRTLAVILLLALPTTLSAAPLTAAVPASGNTSNTGNFSVTLTTTPALVFPDPTLPPSGGGQSARHWQQIIVKPGGTSGATVFCSRFNSNPSSSDPSSFELGPWGNTSGLPSTEAFAPPVLPPPFALWCVASSGTVELEAEAY